MPLGVRLRPGVRCLSSVPPHTWKMPQVPLLNGDPPCPAPLTARPGVQSERLVRVLICRLVPLLLSVTRRVFLKRFFAAGSAEVVGLPFMLCGRGRLLRSND